MSLQGNTLSIVHPMAFPGPGNSDALMRGEAPADYVMMSLRTILDDDDFGAIEVTNINDSGIRSEAATLLKSSGKTVTFGCYGVQLAAAGGGRRSPALISSPDPLPRAEALSDLRELLEQAVEMGAQFLAVLSGKDLALIEDRQGEGAEQLRGLQRDALVESLAKLCDEAGRSGVTVLLEPFDRLKAPPGSKAVKGALIGPAEEAVAVCSKLHGRGATNIGLLPDTSHMVLLGEGPEALRTLAPHLKWFHVATCVCSRDTEEQARRYGDNHPAFGVAGSEVDASRLRGYLRVLDEIGYTGPIGFEVKPIDDEDPIAVISGAKSVLREALAGV